MSASRTMRSLSFGAVLWDVIEGVEHLGGAPFNLAVHLGRLGFESYAVTAIGEDERGDRIQTQVAVHGIVDTWVRRHSHHPTSFVTVRQNDRGESAYEIHEGGAMDFIDLSDEDVDQICEVEPDILCYGSLEQRSATTRSALHRLLRKAKEKDLRTFCDLNIRQHYYDEAIIRESLDFCDILKLNNDETKVVRDLGLTSDLSSDREIALEIRENFEVELVVVTRGSEGCLVVAADGEVEVPGLKVDVVDTVGPGDAFSAAFLWDYLNGRGIRTAAENANRLGAFVASRRGALPDYDAEIRSAFQI